MTRFAVLTLAAALLTAVGATAQTKEIDAEVKRKLEATRQAELGMQLDSERAEDVEVLRRILNKSLGLPNKATTTQQSWPAQPSGIGGFGGGIGGFGDQTGGIGGFSGFGGGNSGHGLSDGGLSGTPQPLVNLNTAFVTQPTVGPFDGVYLPGHGVVFTLHVPEQLGFWLRPPDRAVGLYDFCVKCHATEPMSRADLEPAAQAGKPASEWDRVREELQGKKPETKPQQSDKESPTSVCEPGKTADRLVSKLANARHVRHLPAAERITVVVTFDGVSGSARSRQVLSGPVSGETEDRGASIPHRFTAEESKLIALGDLHLKQGKPRDAAAAYERALARFKEPYIEMIVPDGLGETQAQTRALVIELEGRVQDTYAKLAQAWLAAGDKEKAAAALNMSRKFSVNLFFGPPPTKGKASFPVPAKLIVSVAKSDLDKAGDDLSALKKAVRIELTGFPPPDKKK